MSPTSTSTVSTSFVVSPQVFIRRGFAEVKPKRLNISKLLAAVVHQQINLMGYLPDEVQIFADYSPSEVDEVRKFLRHLCLVRLMPFSDELFFESLQKRLDGSRIVAVVGTKDPQLSPKFVSAARAIAAIAPQSLDAVDQELKAQLSLGRTYEDLVYEESVGKTNILELERHSLKLLKRHMKDQWMLMEKVHSGWGLGAFGISNQRAKMSAVIFKRANVELTPADINLEIAERIVFYLQEWLKSIDFKDFHTCSNAIVTTPYHVLTGQIMNLMKAAGNPHLRFGLADFIYGWHPVLTLMEQLTSDELPIIMVQVEKFPTIHFSLVIRSDG